MRTLYFCLTLLALMLPASLSAQTSSATSHPTDGNATLIGTFSPTIFFATNKPDREVGGYTNVCVFRVAGGGVEYVINADSTRLFGVGSTLDSIATVDIFDDLSRAAVAQGVARGFSPCVATGTTQARVLNPSCVTRTGSGAATRFAACGPNTFCARTFEISCTNGPNAPTITLLPAPPHPPVCVGGGCSTTCR